MIQSDTPGKRRLFKLLDRIIGEEQNFKRNSQAIQILHQGKARGDFTIAGKVNAADELECFRLAHDAMFKIHRKFINEHELVIQRCLAISRQTRAGLLNEDEMAMEVERLQRELRRIKQEHSQVEKECRQILKAQRQYFDNSNGRN